jgi:hypothetical protein
MKYLYKISSITAIAALIAAFSFSVSFAQDTSSYQDTTNTNSSGQYTLSGKVVSPQSQAVANATVTLMKGNNGSAYQNNTMQGDTTDTTQIDTTQTDTTDTTMNTTSNYNSSGMSGRNSGQPMTATTDQNGRYNIQNIPSGTYTLMVKADGYQNWKQQVTISKNGSRTITLKKSSQ